METPITFTVETLLNVLLNIDPKRPMYVVLNGKEYVITEVQDSTRDRVILHLEVE